MVEAFAVLKTAKAWIRYRVGLLPIIVVLSLLQIGKI
jgi:hypothetical protein